MLRAFDDFTFDQAFAEMGISVGADAVGCVEFARFIAIECEGLFDVVKTNHVFVAKVGCGTDFDPAV